MKAQVKKWSDVDWQEVERELAKICDCAGELGIHVVLGCNHNSPSFSRPRNSLYVISDLGEIISRYDKRFCSHTEITSWYSAGKELCVFEIDGWKFGCALCIEIQFPEIFLEYEANDVDCVLLSAYASDPMYWTQAQGHAACNNLWISLATPAQCSEVLPGGLVGPDGSQLIRVTSKEIGKFILCSLDKHAPELNIAINKARPWRRLARLKKALPNV